MIERPQYKYFGTMAEHFQQMDEMFEKERKRIAAFTREEADQYLKDAGVYHLLVRPKRRTPWRTKSTRRKAKDAAKLKRRRLHG
ncbi:hypothetical protein HGH92_19580 [Chitinophaga varians]|uniref:Uncharacterized protein n=1 Tax=Chitinophaga varians TaxID=2202339 RepID=A0A847RL18_9BACT|nr:hypothetical protein [Chitinophaga varians]NLR66520.1 hypothetical protein [Chitinophaga varians]